MKYSLWIDDIRNPSVKAFVGMRELSLDELIVWAKDLEQAAFYVKRYGIPLRMYLDHDLGKETIMDFLKWLVEKGYGLDFEYVLITANTEGKKNIVSFIESWKKSQ